MTAFLLTWKENNWPYENITRMLRIYGRDGFVVEPWKIFAHKQVKIGDKVWLLKQGKRPKGVFGFGQIVGHPSMQEVGNGKTRMMAPVRFSAFVDPQDSMLLDEQSLASILTDWQFAQPASGYPLTDNQAENLTRLLNAQSDGGTVDGTDWTPTELDAVVSDYFLMLLKDLRRQQYSKTKHRASLQRVVRRSKGAIERKHQNISAVLRELGYRWIPGYKPLGHYQDALCKAIDARLDGRLQDAIDSSSEEAVEAAAPGNYRMSFVDPPSPEASVSSAKSFTRLALKVDRAKRDASNRRLGEAGELLVFRSEQQLLRAAGQATLASEIVWASREVGDGLGYDIESFEADGKRIFISVKTTRGPIHTPFYVTENELAVSRKKGAAYRLYRVFDFGTRTRAFKVPGPLREILSLTPVTYRARVRRKPP